MQHGHIAQMQNVMEFTQNLHEIAKQRLYKWQVLHHFAGMHHTMLYIQSLL